MTRIRTPLLVGLVGVVGAVAFVVLFGTVQQVVVSPGDGYVVTADFEDASGLASHSRVTISGIPVGTIESVGLVSLPNGATRARVSIRLGDDIALFEGAPLPGGGTTNGAMITRRTATLLGDYYLEIAPGLGGDRLEDGDAIGRVVGESGIMALSANLEKVTDLVPRLQEIADNVAVTTGSIAAVYGGTEGQLRLHKITEDIQKAASDVALLTGDIRAFVGREVTDEGDSRLGRILDNFERIAAGAARFTEGSADSLAHSVDNVEDISGEVRSLMVDDPETGEPGDLRTTVNRLNTSLENLEKVTSHLVNIAGKIDAGEGSLGKLINEPTLVDKTEEVVEEVGDLVKSVSRLETQIGFRSEFNFFQRALKNYLSLRLQPSKDKYYLIEVAFDPRGTSTVTDTLTVTNDPTKPPAVYERTTETSTKLKFSLQFARRLSFFTGRFGLIEGTGGFGADFEFFKDSLMISADMFDFSADQYPRLKVLLSFAFLDYFYVSAGVDDVINQAGRDYFVGLGFRFTDNDLKALLITAPSGVL
ncbi:MAG: MCE family protein [Deltaproteobacteria bacterium]|nr:MCE family protein [Deltaproteobacteria bacterium]